MPTVKIVPFPGVPGPAGSPGPRGYQGEVGLTGAVGPAGANSSVAGPVGPAGEDAVFGEPVAWTPVFSSENEDFLQSSNLATGSYIKYGKLVHLYMTIPFTNVTDFGTGAYLVSVPFAPAHHTDSYGGTIHNTSSGTFNSIKAHLDVDSNVAELWYLTGTAQDDRFDYNSPILLDQTDLVHLSLVYQAAE